MRATASLLLFLLLATTGAGVAQTPDLMTASAAIFCSLESGAAAAVCNEYCTTLACPQVDDGDGGAVSAPAADCAKTRARFKSLTGREVPCEEVMACPCADPSKWSDFAVATLWQTYAMGAFNRDFATCTDDASLTEIQEYAPDIDPFRVGVDVSGPECRVFSEGNEHRLRIGSEQARTCQRLLRRAGGELCR